MTELNSCVLIADDEPYILRSLSFVLKRAGIEVHEARNGLDALELIRRRRPAVVFLDIMMPARNGYDVCREVKSDDDLQGVHVILLTAKGQEIDRTRGFDAGADEFITKPFSPSVILEKTQAILEKASPRGAAKRPDY